MNTSSKKLLYEFGRLRLGQTVLWNKLEYAPTNQSGRFGITTESFDVSARGKIIQIQEVSTGVWVTVEFESLATRAMHVDPDGMDRGNFGSLSVLKDSYQLEVFP